jgi:NADPH-dependent 2,4-dienoyl-CoA reductase/sulfur reductase-like enzyme
MRIVIIGGDAAGMSAASQARRVDPDAEVVVLELTQDVSYGACGLPYKLPDGKEMEDLCIIPAERFRTERGIDVRLGHEVTALDPAGHGVRGQGPDGPFELRYDRLVIATGARASRPPIPGLEALWGDGAYPLKTLEDGRVLKAALARRPRSAVVIGGGYIGLETTENLREQGLGVTVVEALPHILPFLPGELRDKVYAEARAHGVAVHLETRVEGLERDPGGMIRLQSSAGDLKADVVLVSTGVRPVSGLAAEAGIALGAAGSIAVNERLETSAADIYAAGDCADARHGLTGRSVWIPLALRANRAGKLAGGNAAGRRDTAPPVMGTAVFKIFGLQVGRTGLSEQEARESGFEPVSTAINAATRAKYYGGGGRLGVWLLADKTGGRLLGGAMVGPEGAAHRIDTVVACLHAGLTVEQLYAMDLGYAPPFGPSWSPLLTCASQLMKKLS